jgi:hypothetical protein
MALAEVGAHKPPFLRGPTFVATKSGDLARLLAGASQLRDSAGFQPNFAEPRGTREPFPSRLSIGPHRHVLMGSCLCRARSFVREVTKSVMCRLC